MTVLTTSTARDLVNAALRAASIIGIGQTAQAEDSTDGLRLLNEMLAEWSAARWFVYCLKEYQLTSTGANSYTFGPGGAFTTDTDSRPDRLEYAFNRQIVNTVPNQVDYPLEIIEAQEDYSRIALKTLGAFPQAVYYRPDMPLGTLYFYPVPQASIYEMHVGVKQLLPQLSNQSDNVLLPPPYYSAIRWNLARRLRAEYGRKALPDVNLLAKSTLREMIRTNVQMPRLQMPVGLWRGGLYNIFSDTVY